jgi:hypothetical protein
MSKNNWTKIVSLIKYPLILLCDFNARQLFRPIVRIIIDSLFKQKESSEIKI